MIQNPGEFLDTYLAYRILKGRYNAITENYGLSLVDLPPDISDALDTVTDAKYKLYGEMIQYTDGIFMRF